MADIKAPPSQLDTRYAARSPSHPDLRPLPFRTSSEPDNVDWNPESFSSAAHARRKSTYTFSSRPRVKVRRSRQVAPRTVDSTLEPEQQPGSGTTALSPVLEQGDAAAVSQLLTPPTSPDNGVELIQTDSELKPESIAFDFMRIDYELNRARCIGRGLWSSVYLAEPIIKSPARSNFRNLTPPRTPERKPTMSKARLFAVKVPARPDANDIFNQEAQILTTLQRSAFAHDHIVSFHGLDGRNSALIFEGVIGGSLGDLTNRLKVMTELARHLELRALFPGLAADLAGGLRFIHNAGIVHADIKPTNILLDITDNHDLQEPVLRARYIDFSASFVSGELTQNAGGGTWDFLAPEQLQSRKDLSTPTFASDVWSLGITLLSTIVGGSPYSAMCGGNLFMLREAIKRGDPLGFARSDLIVQKRMDACQDFVDCCRLALQKDRERRYTAAAWEAALIEL